MSLRRLAALLFLAAVTAATAQQFDIDAYRRFLDSNRTLDAGGVLNQHDAGWFHAQVSQPMGFASARYSDSLDHHYHLTPGERSLIDRNGFVVTQRLRYPDMESAFLDVYNRDLPVYVSSDAILYTVHMSYDAMLQEIERSMLIPRLGELLERMHAELPRLAASYADEPRMKTMLRDVDLYLTVPRRLLARHAVGTLPQPVFSETNARLEQILEYIEQKGTMEDTLFTSNVARVIDYSQFTVRGHYTSEQYPIFGDYFQAMIWLGRTELYLIAPESALQSATKEDIQRQTIDAVLLNELAARCGADSLIDQMETTLAYLVGAQDNVTPANLRTLNAKTGVARASQLLDMSVLENYQHTLRTESYAFQRILSQILFSDPHKPEKIVPASAFLMLGQRFIIDSYITGNVVYDRIEFNGQKVRRMLPSTLDILFALGNDAAGQLLQPDLRRYNYAPNLNALRFLVDSYDPAFWNETYYNGWLGAIRTLNPPRDRNGLPPFMRTAAWWQQKMNTQLASWAQLRHDNLLYAKQSYSGGVVGCSYPMSLVEPVPEFYRSLAHTMRGAALRFGTVPFSDTSMQGMITSYFTEAAHIMDTLESVARKELRNESLTGEEMRFLQTMLYEMPSGCSSAMVGWYMRLFYTPVGSDVKSSVVADVHTAPTDEYGNVVGWVLHGGTGPIDMLITSCTMANGQNVAFIGPVMSYYEHVSTNFKRLTDEEWETAYGTSPSFRPAFTNLYLADSSGVAQGEPIMLISSVDAPRTGTRSPGALTMNPSYPNPFVTATTISFTVAPSQSYQPVRLMVYDAGGRAVRSLLAETLPSGNYAVRWDGADDRGGVVPSGTYLYRLSVGSLHGEGQVVRSEK